MKIVFCFLLLLLQSIVFLSQNNNQTGKSYKVKKKNAVISVDGRLEEKVWLQLENMTDFIQNFPTDSFQARSQTEVKIFFDDEFLYVGAKMLDTLKGNYYIETLKRDFSGGNVDGFHILFDTYNDYNNGFNFSITPYGSQRESLILNGGKRFRDIDRNWDNKWYSEAYIEEGKFWSMEMKIPFKILRYNQRKKKWRANFYRLDNKQNERSVWNKVTQGNLLFNLAFCGDLEFEEELPSAGRNLVFIPYLLGAVSENKEDGTPVEYPWNIGGDAKLGLTPSLNLDLTVNPDFSQVEADNQQVNLSRFELFFPEKRQFFIENGDLFASLGTGETQRPFFSRRIGLALDTNDELINVPIYAGMRLTGKLSPNFRVGLLNMETGKDNQNLYPNINYTAAVVQQKVLSSSNITGFVLNKQALFNNKNDSFVGYSLTDYNRVTGVEFNYASPDGKWVGKSNFHYSFTSNSSLDQSYAVSTFLYNVVPRYNWFVSIASNGKNYNSEMGFVPRVDISRFAFGGELIQYPKNSIFQRNGIGFNHEMLWNQNYGVTDVKTDLYQFNALLNTSFFAYGGRYQYTYLYEPFDPSGSDALQLDAFQGFHYFSGGFFVNSDNRKKFFARMDFNYGAYFNGTRLIINPRVRYLFRPFLRMILTAEYNSIRLPKPYASNDIWLITLNSELTLTRNLFFNSLIQYNTQINNFGMNNRLQWRFAPVSDLFLVYSENFTNEISGRFQTRDRYIALKLTYWLNR